MHSLFVKIRLASIQKICTLFLIFSKERRDNRG
jgi:hypothetical protein